MGILVEYYNKSHAARVIDYLGTPTHPQESPCPQPRPTLEFQIAVQDGIAVQGGKIAKIKSTEWNSGAGWKNCKKLIKEQGTE